MGKLNLNVAICKYFEYNSQGGNTSLFIFMLFVFKVYIINPNIKVINNPPKRKITIIAAMRVVFMVLLFYN